LDANCSDTILDCVLHTPTSSTNRRCSTPVTESHCNIKRKGVSLTASPHPSPTKKVSLIDATFFCCGIGRQKELHIAALTASTNRRHSKYPRLYAAGNIETSMVTRWTLSLTVANTPTVHGSQLRHV
jgi:hypothetical protein